MATTNPREVNSAIEDPTWAATNNPLAAPAIASPMRSSRWANFLTRARIVITCGSPRMKLEQSLAVWKTLPFDRGPMWRVRDEPKLLATCGARRGVRGQGTCGPDSTGEFVFSCTTRVAVNRTCISTTNMHRGARREDLAMQYHHT